MEKLTELENHELIVCAWRLDTEISAEDYVTALDRLIYLAKKEVFDEIDKKVFGVSKDGWGYADEEKYKKIKQRHLNKK